MERYTLGATDGVIGRVRDYYFDDEAWVIRYLIVVLDESAARREVLISPIALGQPDESAKLIPTSLTRMQISKSPDIDTHKPVSRQHESEYANYYEFGDYWGGGGLWGAGIYPDELQAGRQQTAGQSPHAGGDMHLRSGNEIMRYYVHASDGDLGHVEGLLVDERTWAIRYLIVNTSDWWVGHQVILSPQWIDAFNWAESHVSFGLTRQQIKDSPPYDAMTALSEDLETGTHAHYGRAAYSPRNTHAPRPTPEI